MKPSRVLSTWLALLLLAGTAPVHAQQEPAGEQPPPELTPPPLVPVPPPGEQRPRAGEEKEPSGREPKPPASRPPDGEPSGREPAPPVSTEALPRRDAAPPPEDPVPRVALEVVGGIVGGVVGGAAGVGVGYLLGAPTVGCNNECQVTAAVGGFTGVVLGIPAGTWLGGRVMGGQGRFLATVAGSAVGWGGFLLGTLLLGDDNETLALALLTLPVAGASVGYELSHSAQRRAATEEPAVRVVPVAGFGARGPRLGLLGRF
ncbi:MAG TPA: GlsB/YeaQ/YmgE family stress response membrane protein [Myxococcus sp.]|nr:GlsB/YeaQ/YmgE family stress response membrane protein [Myxococcus sp.]